ncbi:hypothetical protein EJ03DRAFT_349080 [Teratosphaeria nubilosa]|uniref:Uncharacterized protein n=1 Tax=Teratosphaeria nubilosa TaxID=161662 RepID=A0A6G1LHF6_9PEZI|nr:hypothetical protein EJ03DRAFT_349080 [Teratosphaeria nubilosa]
MHLRIVLTSFICAAMAAKHRLCACTRSEDHGEIDEAVTQLIAESSHEEFTYSPHGWCKEDGAPRNGYYLFAKPAQWWQDDWVGGDEMHRLCVEKYTAGASVCFDPNNGNYENTTPRDLAWDPCLD